MIGYRQVPYLALRYQIVERAPGLIDRDPVIPVVVGAVLVQVEQVDVIRLQPLQALVHAKVDIRPGGAELVRREVGVHGVFGAHRVVNFGCHDDLFLTERGRAAK